MSHTQKVQEKATRKSPKPKHKTDANNRPKYATIKNPTIEAILGENFRFANEAQALARIESLRDTFIVSPLPKNIDDNSLAFKLWIRGYGLTSEAREAGYIGNYARFEIKPVDNGKFTLAAVLVSVDKKYHPQRRQTAKRHPNWGHPIMRDIQKGRVHKTVESAQTELTRLHEMFPEVSIPLTNKMYIMVYRKQEDESQNPIQKWVLEIKALDTGGFKIEYAPNTYQGKGRPTTEASPTKQAAPKQGEAIGRFTSQVLLKKSKKRGATPLPPKKEEE